MTDQVPSENRPPILDFTGQTVIGLPSGPPGPPGPPGGITSVNGDATAAQIIAAGAGITVTPGPAGTNTIAATGVAAGVDSLVSFSGGVPVTGPVTLRARTDGSVVLPTFSITTPFPGNVDLNINSFAIGNPGLVADPGAAIPGENRVLTDSNAFVPIPGAFANTAGTAPGAIVNGAPAIVGTITIPAGGSGFYTLVFTGGLNGIALQLMDLTLQKNGVDIGPGPSAWGFKGLVEVAGQPLLVSGAAQVAANAGDVITLVLLHHGGGANTTSLDATLAGYRMF